MSDKLSGDPGADAAHLLKRGIGHNSGTLVGELKIKPQDQARLLLGSFTDDDQLKGFSVEVKPKPDPHNSVVTHIAYAGTASKFKLMLHIINYGTKPVKAKVWQL